MQQPGGILCTSWQLGGRHPTTQNCRGLTPRQPSNIAQPDTLRVGCCKGQTTCQQRSCPLHQTAGMLSVSRHDAMTAAPDTKLIRWRLPLLAPATQHKLPRLQEPLFIKQKPLRDHHSKSPRSSYYTAVDMGITGEVAVMYSKQHCCICIIKTPIRQATRKQR